MPQTPPSEPPVMTWSDALPKLVVSGVSDALKFMFQQFWFFGPALLGTGTAAFIGQYLGSAAGGVTGSLVGIAAGYFALPVFAVFGSIMAMAVGLIGWLALGLWVAMTNARIFKANASGGLWFAGSLAGGIVPFVGTIPFMTATLVKLYATQIRVEKQAHEKWRKEQGAARSRQRTEAAARARLAEAANEPRYSPQEERKAA